MARLQIPRQFSIVASTTPQQLQASETNVTSFIVQNPSTSSDFVRIGSSSGQLFNVAPGKDITINGDNLDNGTTAYLNLQNWYVTAVSATQTVNILYLERF